MRLTIINQFFVPDISPTANLCASLARHRTRRGDEVTVVTSRSQYVSSVGSTEDTNAEDSEVTVHRIRTPRLGKRTLLRRLLEYAVFYAGAAWRMLRLPRQDVIVSLTTPPFIAWTAVLHRLLHPRCTIVLWNMDCYPDLPERMGLLRPGGVVSRLMGWANRALFRRLDSVVCLDQAMVELLERRYVGPRSRLATYVIPNWEEGGHFPARTSAPTRGDRFVVLYLGNTGVGHDFRTILEAAQRLRDEPIEFRFVGGGSRWPAIEEARREQGLQNVSMRSYVPKEETPGLLAEADCALITLRDLALGVMSPSKLHANLAAGLPVLYVGPAGSNVDEAVSRYDCGASLRNGDVDGVTAFLREAATNAGRAAQMRDNSRRAFEESYCGDRTLPLFDHVIEGRRGEFPSRDATPDSVQQVG